MDAVVIKARSLQPEESSRPGHRARDIISAFLLYVTLYTSDGSSHEQINDMLYHTVKRRLSSPNLKEFGSSCDLIKVLSRNLPGETAQNYEKLSR